MKKTHENSSSQDELLITRLKEKPDIDAFVSEVINKPEMIEALIRIAATDKSSIKFSCTKTIRLVSEQRPDMVYSYFDDIVAMTHNTNSFIKWDGILIISNLIRADSECRFDMIFEDYFGMLKDPQMVTAATVVGNAWKIVSARPDLEPEITRRLLAIPDITYFYKGEPSEECSRVICGHAIDCFEKYFSMSGSQKEILEFVQKQLKSTRGTVVKKAEKFLKKHRAQV